MFRIHDALPVTAAAGEYPVALSHDQSKAGASKPQD